MLLPVELRSSRLPVGNQQSRVGRACRGSPDVCASCGKGSDGEGGTVKLKECTACRLVKYCGVECQKAHRKQHKKACKARVAELKDEQLYSQGQERPDIKRLWRK